MGPLLRTENLTKSYGSFCALDNLTLSLEPGEVFGLLGPNGSGKTTALRLLMGFLRPTSGGAWIKEHDCWHDGVRARQHVAYLPGELRLYENMSGRQLIAFLCDVRGQTLAENLDDLAGRFDIDLELPIAQMSSGMKRKVALLQVLIPHTPLVIMDEPTNTLDPNMRDELLQQVRQARRRGQAVLFSSHVLTEVEQVCDRVGILQRGKLVHVQTMSSLREGRLVRAHFNHPADRLPPLPGLRVLSHVDNELTMEYLGDLPPLLHWLADQPLRELRLEPLGLTSIYHRYHGVQP